MNYAHLFIKSVSSLRNPPLTEKARFLYAQQRANVFKALASAFSVQALVTDLIMPIIGLALPGLGNLADYRVPVASQFFGVGHLIAALITFIMVAFVIFIMVKITKRSGIE